MKIKKLLKSFTIFSLIALSLVNVLPEHTAQAQQPPLAKHTISLENRYPNPSINNIFKDNILLTIAYMTKSVENTPINWQKINKQTQSTIILQPGEVFAFHEDVLPAYKNKKIITTNAHFGASEGFLSSGYLYGDGVCHLASLMYWTAKDAGLKTLAPVNHNFANIPEISREYGVSIFSFNQQQNLYIENNFNKPVAFTFDYKNNKLNLTISFSPAEQ